MRLSAPIFRLKKNAHQLARKTKIPLHRALNEVAKQEGFDSWSLLSAKHKLAPTSAQILDQFDDGDLVLLAARPLQGKTTLGLSLIAEACRAGRFGAFFSLFHTHEEVEARFREFGLAPNDNSLTINTSNDISAPFIIERLSESRRGTVVVIDYLQILDQRRDTPALDEQVASLRDFAERLGVVIIALSQVDRSYDGTKGLPSLTDIYLPNPVDMNAFTKTCFMNDGAIEVR